MNFTLQEYEEGGGDTQFIETVSAALNIDSSKVRITAKREGSVIITFEVDFDLGDEY